MLHEGVTLDKEEDGDTGKEGFPRGGSEPTCFKGFNPLVASVLTGDAMCEWDRLIAGKGCESEVSSRHKSLEIVLVSRDAST